MARKSSTEERPITQLRANKATPAQVAALEDDPPGQSSAVVAIYVRCRTADQCEQLIDKVNTKHRKTRLIKELSELLGQPKRERDRSGELEPQVPQRLRDQLKAKAGALGARKQTALIKAALRQWVDLRKGERRPRFVKVEKKGETVRERRGERRLSSRFIARGRALASEPDLVRFTFNAGSEEAKDAILGLLEEAALTQTEFFSALIERICEGPKPSEKGE